MAKERQLRYKRKRKVEVSREQASVNDLLELSFNVQQSDLSPCENLQKTWTYAKMKDRRYYSYGTPEKSCFRGSKYTITTPIHSDCECAIGYHKLKVNSTVFELSQEYPVFVGGCQSKNPLNITHFYETDEVLQDFLLKENVTYIETEKIYKDKYKCYYSEHLIQKATKASAETSNPLCPRRLMTHVKRLSEDVLQQYLKKEPAMISNKIKRASSTAPSLNDSGFHDYTAEAADELDDCLIDDITLSSDHDVRDTDDFRHIIEPEQVVPQENFNIVTPQVEETLIENTLSPSDTPSTSLVVVEDLMCNKPINTRKSSRVNEETLKVYSFS